MKGIADRVASFNTVPKLKNFPFNADQIRETFSHLVDLDVIKNAQAIVNEFSPIISYLKQARQYIYDNAFVARLMPQSVNLKVFLPMRLQRLLLRVSA